MGSTKACFYGRISVPERPLNTNHVTCLSNVSHIINHTYKL